jgi:C-8 sterol isomerase
MVLLHGSFSEYVIIWGAQLPTTGHSGRNWARFHDWLMSGEGQWWPEGALDVEHHGEGSFRQTEPFTGGVVHLTHSTWMLEYCHGVIPALLPFGLADAVLSSLDPITVFNSFRAYGRLIITELTQNYKI